MRRTATAPIVTTVLLAGALSGAGTATPTASGQTAASALDTGFTQGSESIGPLGQVTVHGTYTCQDTEGTTQARIRVDFVGDNNARGSTDITVPCQVANGTFTATADPDDPLPAFDSTKPVEAHATITKDGHAGGHATGEAVLFRNQLFLEKHPTVTANSNGTYTATGTYGCAGTTPVTLTYTLTAGTSSSTAAGVALLRLSCPATNQPWTATVTPTAATATTAADAGRPRAGNGLVAVADTAAIALGSLGSASATITDSITDTGLGESVAAPA